MISRCPLFISYNSQARRMLNEATCSPPSSQYQRIRRIRCCSSQNRTEALKIQGRKMTHKMSTMHPSLVRHYLVLHFQSAPEVYVALLPGLMAHSRGRDMSGHPIACQPLL